MTLTSILVALGLQLHTPPLSDLLEPAHAGQSPIAASAAVLALTESFVAPPRARLAEVADGAHVTFYNVNTRETESFFFRFDGVLSETDEARLTHLFRCKRTGHRRRPDRGLVQIMARLGERYPDRVFELVSAYRARPYAERDSKHRTGHAMDFRVRGVSLVEVRSFLWELSAKMPIGLGHYHRDGFLHVDHRPEEPSIGWDVRRRGREHYRYNPRWARLLN